jgi:3(or 17)beta-hydroxysteroid dehydrogenase
MRSKGEGRVVGKTAIVTGAASGIGAAIARVLAAEGAAVVLADIDADRGPALAAEFGEPSLFRSLDVTDEGAWRDLVLDVGHRFGKVDILVNNAGIGNQAGRTTPESTTLTQWREMLRINSEGVFLGCRFGIEAMRESGGAIVNIASIASMIPSPPIAAYGFAKAGVEQFTRSVALHCAQAGYRIRCNSVHPGQIRTPMLDGLFAKAAADYGGTSEDMRQAFLARIPQGCFGAPEDIAYGVLYLVSEEARHVTGTRLVIDGGMDLIN